ncbi:MAG: MBL fold metallo-hydrolase [Fusobacteria bacterium]|nr:MBL fold metallo-hydrolase [Fusobacteriota bacterium]
MKLQCFELGVIQTNSYVLLIDEKAILIDTGDFSIEEQLNFILKKEAKLEAVFFTHGHFDHITGIDAILKLDKNMPIYMGENEIDFLEKPEYNLGGMFQMIISKKTEELNIKKISDKDIIDNYGIIAYEMPGHTKGEMVFYIPELKSCVVGDLIFEHGHGRTDLPTSNHSQLKKSILRLFDLLPEETMIFSGHGASFRLKDWDKSQLF